MASLFRSLYDMPGLAPRMDVLFWERSDFQISFSNGDTPRNAWNRQWGSFMVDTGILPNNMKIPLTNVKGYSLTWTYTMITPYWSDFVTNSAFYRILRGFLEHLRRVWLADRGRLLLRTPGPVPLGLVYVLLVETNPFSELVVIFPDYLLQISLGTFSIFLSKELLAWSFTLIESTKQLRQSEFHFIKLLTW